MRILWHSDRIYCLVSSFANWRRRRSKIPVISFSLSERGLYCLRSSRSLVGSGFPANIEVMILIYKGYFIKRLLIKQIFLSVLPISYLSPIRTHVYIKSYSSILPSPPGSRIFWILFYKYYESPPYYKLLLDSHETVPPLH